MNSGQDESWRDILSRIEGKIDQLEGDVQKIKNRVNPPWWKNFASFIINNFFTLLTLVSLVLIAWKAWEFLQNMAAQLEAVKNIPTNTLDSLKDLPSSAGDSIMDMIKNFMF